MSAGLTGERLFRKYRVRLQFRDRLLGGVPRTEEALRSWLEARGLEDLEEATLAEVEMLPEEERSWTGFKSDANGLYIEGRQVKAMLKECAVTLALSKEQRGLRQQLQHGTFVKPDRIYLHISEPSGTMEVLGQVQSPRGPRSIRKKVDYVMRPRIEFEIWTLAKGALTESRLRQILELAQENGLGAMRTQSYGQFDILEFAEVN